MISVGRTSVATAPGAPARLVPAVPSGATRAAQRRRAAAEREHTIVTSLIVAFVFVALAIGVVQLRRSMQVDRSKQAMSATFVKVFELQGTYRLLNGRFATWRELERRGARLTPEQRVVKSNASASHWFLALRDTGTGITCSRTGELFDENPLNRRPSCSNPGP